MTIAYPNDGVTTCLFAALAYASVTGSFSVPTASASRWGKPNTDCLYNISAHRAERKSDELKEEREEDDSPVVTESAAVSAVRCCCCSCCCCFCVCWLSACTSLACTSGTWTRNTQSEGIAASTSTMRGQEDVSRSAELDKEDEDEDDELVVVMLVSLL